MTARSLMVLGSMSSAGKSLLVTGLCRLYSRRGWRVTPFKAQNMSNNAAVCSGGEIGRAQAVQAAAAGVEPTVFMNPVLLKPEADNRSQIVVHGRVWDSLPAARFYDRRSELRNVVTDSLDTLLGQYDLVIMEGAGSPAEMNLYQHDIVNLFPARCARTPCLLVGDIDRGGVFAQLLGTLWLLEEPDQELIKGLVVNKFRGDPDLFTDGIRFLEEHSGVPVLGVLPYLRDHGIPEEDAAALGERVPVREDVVDIAVVHLPHISNFDDFDPLLFEPDVQMRYVRKLEQLGSPDAIILPGTKNTLEDLDWLHESGIAEGIKTLASRGVSVVGLCGGFQMLGEEVLDESGVESSLGKMEGLGLLPVNTSFSDLKTVTRSKGSVEASCGFLEGLTGAAVEGYEIHMGRTEASTTIFRIDTREGQKVDVPDGSSSEDGRIWGTYLHGIFENDGLRSAWIRSLGAAPQKEPFLERRLKAYDGLADELESALNMDLLDKIIEDGVGHGG